MATPEDYIGINLEEIIEGESAEVDVTPSAPSKLITLSQKNNILSEFKDKIDSVKTQLTQQFDEDRGEMEGWFDDYDEALDIAKMIPESEERSFPFENSCNAMTPHLMEAAIEFNSRYTLDVLASKAPASFAVVGMDKPQLAPIPEAMAQEAQNPKADRAERMGSYFNTKLKKSNWEAESDIEAMALPIVGTTYKKVYWNDRLKRVESRYVAADQIIFSQKQSFEDAPQWAHMLTFSRNDLIGSKHSGMYEFDEDKLPDNVYSFDGTEYHFYYDLDGDGIAEPYIATWIEEIDEIIRVRAGYTEEGIHSEGSKVTEIERKEYFAQKKLLSDPAGGPMGQGFGILLKDTYQSVNTNLRQLVDAGTLSNVAANSGLIANVSSPKMGADSRIGEGPIELELGKLLKVNVSSGSTLAQNVVQLPFAGPSATLFSLLEFLINSARRMTTVSYNVEANPGEASSLYLSRLKEGYKSYNAMMYRVYRGLTKEFEIMSRCYFEYADVLQGDYIKVLDEEADMYADFNPADCDIMPTANPANGSDVERMAKAELVVQAAQAAPQMFNQRQAYIDYLDAMGIDNVEELLPEPQGPSPQEKQQTQYLMMEAEFRDRDMKVKEAKLMLEQMTLTSEAFRKAEEFRLQAAKTGSEIDLNIAKAAAEMAGIEMQQMNQIQAMLDRGEKNLQQTIGQTNGTTTTTPGLSASMAGDAGNEGLS